MPILTLVALGVVALAAAALSAVTGVGGGVIVLSALLVAVPAAAVVPLHGAVQLAAGASRVLGFRSHIQWSFVGWFAAGLVPGSLIGWLLVAWVTTLSPSLLKALVAVAILASLWKGEEVDETDSDRPRTPSQRWFIAVGVVCGTLSILVGSTGPIVTQALLRWGVVKEPHVGTKSAMQAVSHVIKLPIFGLALAFDYGAHAALLGLMVVAVIVGTHVGKRLLAHLSAARFAAVTRVILALVATEILVSAIYRAFA